MASDQRHRIRLLASADLPFIPKAIGNFNLGLIQGYDTGAPYGAVGTVRSSNYVTNPGYQQRPATSTYYYTARDAFRTDDIKRTDLSLTWTMRLFNTLELFVQPQVLNLTNNQGAIAVNQTVQTADHDRTGYRASFNPFTTTPGPGRRNVANHDRELELRPELRAGHDRRAAGSSPARSFSRPASASSLPSPSFREPGLRARLLFFRLAWVTLGRCDPEGPPRPPAPARSSSSSAPPAAAAGRRPRPSPAPPSSSSASTRSARTTCPRTATRASRRRPSTRSGRTRSSSRAPARTSPSRSPRTPRC